MMLRCVVFGHERNARWLCLFQMRTGRCAATGRLVDTETAAVAAAMAQRSALVNGRRLCVTELCVVGAQRFRSDANVLGIEAIKAVQRYFAVFGWWIGRVGGVTVMAGCIAGGAVLTRQGEMLLGGGIGQQQVIGIGASAAAALHCVVGVVGGSSGNGIGGGIGVGNEFC